MRKYALNAGIAVLFLALGAWIGNKIPKNPIAEDQNLTDTNQVTIDTVNTSLVNNDSTFFVSENDTITDTSTFVR